MELERSMYRECTRVLSSALLALTGWLQVEALAQSAIETERLLTLATGNLPLVLVAPHGGREAIPGIGIRQGNGVPQFKTGRDHNTGELAAAIAVKLGQMSGAKPFLVIARFDSQYIDANRPSIEAYEALEAQPYYTAFHSAVDEACKQIRQVWGRGLLLDIHGQAAEANVIFRGTKEFFSMAGAVQEVSGFLDDEGYLHVSGRKKSMIKSAGISIFPEEIEVVLRAHADVAEVAVVGCRHPEWGESSRLW